MKPIQRVRVVQSMLMFGSGTPHTENCSQYSGSTDHTCVIVEPPIQRTAAKVKFMKYPSIESLHVAVYGTKYSPNSEELWVWL